MLTEIFIIEQSDLLKQDYKKVNPVTYCEGIDAKGLETVTLASLQSQLTGENFDDIQDQQKSFDTESADGPWIMELPQNLIAALSKSSKEQLKTAF